MASPTVSEVKGILMLVRPVDLAIDPKRSATCCSMPRMSVGPALLKLWKRFMAVAPVPEGSALKCTSGAVPSKMLAAVAVNVAVASANGGAPVPGITLMLAPTLAVMLRLRAPVGLGPLIRLLSAVLVIVDGSTRPLPAG